MKKIPHIVKAVFILTVLSIPLMAVDCCRRAFYNTEYCAYISFWDSTNYSGLPLDSVKFRVLDAPNPNGDSSHNKPYYITQFYLNPNDTVSRAEMEYAGKKDTLIAHYQNKGNRYSNCSKAFEVDINITDAYYTAHWLLPGDGKLHRWDRNAATFGGFGSINTIQLYFKK